MISPYFNVFSAGALLADLAIGGAVGFAPLASWPASLAPTESRVPPHPNRPGDPRAVRPALDGRGRDQGPPYVTSNR
jgi:hypothetical protein